ncbi:MAG: hypothetical protein R3Y59_06915 [bacterium]
MKKGYRLFEENFDTVRIVATEEEAKLWFKKAVAQAGVSDMGNYRIHEIVSYESICLLDEEEADDYYYYEENDGFLWAYDYVCNRRRGCEYDEFIAEVCEDEE